MRSNLSLTERSHGLHTRCVLYMQIVNAKLKAPRRKTLYFNGDTARLLKERALEEHRSESNYLQHLIIQDHRAKQIAVSSAGQVSRQGKL